MRYYPVLLDLKDRPCCVVGGGPVALRKAVTLRAAGARVTVISPALCAGLSRLAKARRLIHLARGFRAGMLKGFFLAVAATDDRRVNEAVSREAARRGMACNVVDVPSLCSFIVPSVIARGGLILSISTGGAAPCLARRMRLDLEKRFIPGYSRALKAVAAERRRLKAREPDIAARKRSLARFMERGCR